MAAAMIALKRGLWVAAVTTDEYLAQLDEPVLLGRIDSTGRLLVKPGG